MQDELPIDKLLQLVGQRRDPLLIEDIRIVPVGPPIRVDDIGGGLRVRSASEPVIAGGAPAGRLAAETRADGRATAASFTGTGSHALLWTTATGQTPAGTAGCGSPSTSESTVRAQSSSGTSRSGCPGLPGRGTEIVPIEPFHTERG